MAKKHDPAEVVVIKTTVPNIDLVIRSGPTNTQVRSFVKEHHRRFLAGEPGGPSGNYPAHHILSAARYENEYAYLAGEDGTPVKIEDLIRDKSAQ